MEAKATIVGDRIMVRTSGGDFETVKGQCKSVLGARWSKDNRAWTYPATVETCHALRATFGSGLVVLPALARWYSEARTSAEQQASLTRATDASLAALGAVAPRLAGTLRPDQRVGAAFVAQGYHGGALVADVPGLGKTFEVVAGVLERRSEGPVLVVCPKVSVRQVWGRTIDLWAPGEAVYLARGTRQQREATIAAFDADPRGRKWLVVVAEMLRVKEEPDPKDPEGKKKVFAGFEYPSLFQRNWDTVIVDESQKVMGSLTVVKGNLMGKGLKRLKADRRIAMSGTPFGRGGRVQGMFGTLHWMWPEEYTSFWRWAERYFEVDEVHIGRGKTAKKINGLKGGMSEEEFLRSLGPRILRRTKAEVLPWLPPKQYVEVVCEMGRKQQAQYERLMSEGEIGSITANGVLALITRAKQVANGVVDASGEGLTFTDESAKIEMLMQKLDERGILDGDGDTKVIVSSQFNEFLFGPVARALDAAGVAYHVLRGSSTDAAREAAVDAFQGEGGARVFLLNAKAGGVSITLDAADEVHCLDELWNPEDNEQLEDRVHRASRNHQVTIFYYRSEGTIDQAIAEDVEGKRFAQFRVLDGRRGLEYAREMIQFRKAAK